MRQRESRMPSYDAKPYSGHHHYRAREVDHSPARGGKRRASRPRKMSDEHMAAIEEERWEGEGK